MRQGRSQYGSVRKSRHAAAGRANRGIVGEINQRTHQPASWPVLTRILNLPLAEQQFDSTVVNATPVLSNKSRISVIADAANVRVRLVRRLR